MNTQFLLSIVSLPALLAAALFTSPAAAQSTTRVSVTSQGDQVSGSSTVAALSADGWTVAFQSQSPDLVPGDTNGVADIFVHDRLSGRTTRVSLSSAGMQADSFSLDPSLSADGRLVAFSSQASNLVPGDTNLSADVFVHDLATGQTHRVSVGPVGAQGNDHSNQPSISADGRYVAFVSRASNLVPGDTIGMMDGFVHDLLTGQTSRVTVNGAGIQGNGHSDAVSISGDGRFVAFASEARNLVSGDTNLRSDVFVHDRQTGQVSRVSVDSNGLQGIGDSTSPSISADGRFVAFLSPDDLVFPDVNGAIDVFVHDRQTGQTVLASVSSSGTQANSASAAPVISADGRMVAFQSGSNNLVPGDANMVSDVFMHHLTTRRTLLASVSSAGVHGNQQSLQASLSADGRTLAFDSSSANLVPGDSNGAPDVFVRDLEAGAPVLAKAGGCPGAITLTISEATPQGRVAVACGPAGSTVRVLPPCSGLDLGVGLPAAIALLTADGAGVATLTANAPPGACGLSIQAVDVTTCLASNVIVL